jgi:alkane 1-monooxygenase
MSHFVLASLLPFALTALGALGLTWAVWAALAWFMLIVPILDVALPRALDARLAQVESKALPMVLGLTHLALFPLVIFALSGATGLDQTTQIGLFAATAMVFGQISASNAHELIHAARSLPRQLGRIVYATILFGHHATAHPAIHHRFVATPRDPNSARPGESLYAFLPRAWIGSFHAGWNVEVRRLAQRGHSPWHATNPYLQDATVVAVSLGVSAALGGIAGVAAHLGIGTLAAMQLLTSDYVQHYGLHRAKTASGKYEPLSARHSWNAPNVASRLMMLNAPLHSEHHLHPATPFPALGAQSAAQGPMLPASLPLMAALAFWPAQWHRIMGRELTKLHLAEAVPPMPRSRAQRAVAAEHAVSGQ